MFFIDPNDCYSPKIQAPLPVPLPPLPEGAIAWFVRAYPLGGRVQGVDLGPIPGRFWLNAPDRAVHIQAFPIYASPPPFLGHQEDVLVDKGIQVECSASGYGPGDIRPPHLREWRPVENPERAPGYGRRMVEWYNCFEPDGLHSAAYGRWPFQIAEQFNQSDSSRVEE